MLNQLIPFKVLRCLENGRELNDKEIADALEEDRESVRRALDNFVERGILVKANDVYKSGPKFNFIFKKMLEIYERITIKTERGQIIRGLLSLLPRSYPINLDFLLRMAQVEGFNEKEIVDFLNEEVKRRLVWRVKIVSSTELPFFIDRTRKMRLLNRNDIEIIMETWMSSGLKIYEKVFFLPRYPTGMAKSSRIYLEGRKELMEKIESEIPSHIKASLWRDYAYGYGNNHFIAHAIYQALS